MIKTPRILRRSIAILFPTLLAGLSSDAMAGSATWNATTGGTYNWQDTSNWDPNTTFPNATTDVANINNDITGDITINLGANRIINDLNLGDAMGNNAFTIAPGVTGSVLWFLGTSPSLDISGGGVNTISAGIGAGADLVLRSNATAATTISSAITNNGVDRNLTFNNDINGVAAPAATGTGQFVLGAANTIGGTTGTVTISDVRVTSSVAGALGANPANTVTVNNAGQVFLSGGTHVNNFILNSTGWFETAGNLGALRLEGATISGNVALTQTALIGVNANATGTITGVISGTGGITKVGGTNTGGQGVLLLSGNNTFSGPVVVENGTIRVSNRNALGTNTSVTVQASPTQSGNSGNTLDIRTSGLAGLGKTVTLFSDAVGDRRSTLLGSLSGAAWAGDVILSGSGINQISASSFTLFTISGNITSTGADGTGTMAFRGAGTVILFGNIHLDRAFSRTDGGTVVIVSTGNSWTRTEALDGQIQISAPNALPEVEFTFGQNSGTGGRLELDGFDQAVTRLNSFSSSTGTHTLRNSNVVYASTLTFATPTGSTDILTNVNVLGAAAGTGALHLVSNGLGRTEFNGGLVSANTWTVNSGTVSFGGTNARILAGSVTGTAGATIEKAGAAALTVTGTLNHAGSTNVTDGRLLLSNGTLAALTVADGASLATGLNGGHVTATSVNFGSVAATTFAPILSTPAANASLTAGTVTVDGTGVTITPQAGTFSVGTYKLIDYGTLAGGFSAFALGPLGSYPHVTATLVDNTTDGRVDLNVTAVDSLIWTGTANGVWDVNTTSNFALASSPTTAATFYTGDAVVFGDTADLPTPVVSVTSRAITGNAIPNGDLTFNNSAGDYSVENPLIGAGGVTKNGTSTVTLSGANTYAGPTRVNNGVLILSGANTLSGPVTINGGTLRLGNSDGLRGVASVTVANGGTFDANGIAIGNRFTEIIFSGTGVGGMGAIVNTGAAITTSGHFAKYTMAADATWGGTGRYDIVSTQLFDGGSFTLTKVGTGELRYNPATGSVLENVVVNGGFFGSQRSNPMSATATVTVNNGGTHQLHANTSIQHRVVLTDGGTFRNSDAAAGGTANGVIEFSGPGINHVLAAAGSLDIAGKVTGEGGFTKSGSGTLRFRNAENDYRGDTRIIDGTLTFDETGQIPTTTRLIIDGGIFATRNVPRTVAGLSGTGGTISGGNSVIVNQNTDTTWSGVLTSTTIVKNGGGVLTLAGTADNDSGSGVVNAGTLVLAKTGANLGPHTFGSGLTINSGGTARLAGSAAALTGTGVNTPPTGAPANYVDQIRNDIIVNLNAGGTLDMGGRSEAVQGITGDGKITNSISGTTSRVYIGSPGGTNSNTTFAGVIEDGAGLVQLEKLGAALLTLVGGNTFTGGVTQTAGNITVANTGSLGNTPINVAAGTFALNGAHGSGAIALTGSSIFAGTGVSAGTLTASSGTTVRVGTASSGMTSAALTVGGLVMTGGANLNLDFDTAGSTVDRLAVTTPNGVNLTGINNVNVVLSGAGWVTGSYPILQYTGTLGGAGLSALNLTTPKGHSSVNLFNNEVTKTVNLEVTALVNKWVGGSNTTWDTNNSLNWNAPDQRFLTGDTVVFDDSAANTTVTLFSNQTPSGVTFDNDTRSFTVTTPGSAGIAGTAGLIKKNRGTVTISSANTYTGLTDVQEGTLIANYHINTGLKVFATASNVNVAAGATLRLVANDANFTFANALSGTGTVIIDPHLTGATSTRQVTLSGNNANFSGVLRLSPTTGVPTGLGTFQTSPLTPENTGTATFKVDSGGQVALAGGATFINDFIITGMGYAEAEGGIPVAESGLIQYSGPDKGGTGALRISGGTILTGRILIDGTAKIQSYGGTIAGTISTANPADTLVIGGGSSGTTIILTGTNDIGASPLGNIFVNSGGTAGDQVLSIGNNGTTGTLGTGSVTLNGGGAVGVLRFDRADGYALSPGNTITSMGTTSSTQLRIEAQGQGFLQNGVAINLGSGSLRFGTLRANATGTFDGNVTVGSIHMGTNATGSVMNILPGANIANSGSFFLGEQNGFAATVNQLGGAATAGTQFRVGHYPNNVSVYNLGDGTLTIGANPGLATDPSGGGEQNGGIYLGIDGTGVMNHVGGTVTTDWVVLDNRGDTAGATGTDQYNLSGGTLQIRGQYGIANRNASTAFNFTGGVIRNVGTGVNARIIGAGTFNIGSGGTGTPTIDTGAATNAITVSRALTGTGALVKQGAGTLALNAASPAWTGNLSIEAGIVSTNAIDGGLGSFTTAGRTITARNGATLSLGINNVFGNGVGNANLPALTLEGSTLSSTRYNAIGAVTLKDGSTLTQAATDGPGAFEGYQFLGNITVTGTGASTITTTNGRANHLSASTVFQVEDTTGDAATDLVVSAPLKDPSSAFGGAGSLVKSGGGTMELAAGTVSTYTGTTEVEEGLLMVSGSVSGSTFLVSGGVLSGAGGTTGPINVTDGILAPGASIGTLNAGSTSLGANSTFALEINTTALTTDRLAITGNLSLADLDTATLTITDLAPTPFSGAPLQFITYTGVWDGDFFSYAGNVIPDGGALTVGGNTFYLDYDYQGNSVALVPEPTAVLSLLGGLGVLAGVRRRRK